LPVPEITNKNVTRISQDPVIRDKHKSSNGEITRHDKTVYLEVQLGIKSCPECFP